jgi:hypothetical protein
VQERLGYSFLFFLQKSFHLSGRRRRRGRRDLTFNARIKSISLRDPEMLLDRITIARFEVQENLLDLKAEPRPAAAAGARGGRSHSPPGRTPMEARGNTKVPKAESRKL